MKQVLQGLKDGETVVADVPPPRCGSGALLIRTHVSLISTGTERMLVDFGKANLLDKARQQPDKVRQTIDKIWTDGIAATVEAVRAKLDQPIPMGYSNVGEVVEVGPDVRGYAVGDRVVSNGHHAEIVAVPQNLCAKIPDGVSDENAAFTVVGAIALQGVRLAGPTLGESFAVFGLGLIGLLTVQILIANGCRVIGFDFDEKKVTLAREFGAEAVQLTEASDPVKLARSFSQGAGIDGVLLTASTKSSEPVRHAAQMCRKRGRIVLVGVTGLDLDRDDFYEKELSFQVSCSYGPGRYDPSYEHKGHDYPIGFVRWTEQRNFEAILSLMATGRLKLDRLRSRTFDIDQATDAYGHLTQDRSALGILLKYPESEPLRTGGLGPTIMLKPASDSSAPRAAVVGAIGAGNYAGRVLLPAFGKTNCRLKSIVSHGGVSGTHYGKKLGFEQSTTEAQELFDDPEINTIIIATRHDSHAKFAIEALGRGKHVFVEKPLALTTEEIDAIEAAYGRASEEPDAPKLMVGFNRRFSPLMQDLKADLGKSEDPISLIYTCNAGAVPADSWVQDPAAGGGRIVGEACHFIDIARFLAGAPITSVRANYLNQPKADHDTRDTATISLSFENGSIATIHYFANGHRTFPKERIEVFQGSSIAVIDNFRQLRSYGKGAKRRQWQQRKGQTQCCEAFISSIASGTPSPIPFEELIEVSRAAVVAGRA